MKRSDFLVIKTGPDSRGNYTIELKHLRSLFRWKETDRNPQLAVDRCYEAAAAKLGSIEER